MGYHIITDTESEKPTSQYINNLDELMQHNNIPTDSIVYQGKLNAKPVRLRHHEILKDYIDPEKRVVRRAELKFETLAQQNGYLIQKINLEQKDYARYLQIIGEHPSRSDYLVLNLANIEIDVQCMSLTSIDSKKYFYMNKNDIQRHYESISTVDRRLIFAIFDRDNDGYKNGPVGMISLEQVMQCELIGKGDEERYLIPPQKIMNGFELLNLERAAISANIIKKMHTGRGRIYLTIRKIALAAQRYSIVPVAIALMYMASYLAYQEFPWITLFKQQFEIIFMCSLTTFLIGRLWRK